MVFLMKSNNGGYAIHVRVRVWLVSMEMLEVISEALKYKASETCHTEDSDILPFLLFSSPSDVSNLV